MPRGRMPLRSSGPRSVDPDPTVQLHRTHVRSALTSGRSGSRPSKLRGAFMPAVPRIRRATPQGPPTRPERPLPVIARIR
jgi:hypothetical protein